MSSIESREPGEQEIDLQGLRAEKSQLDAGFSERKEKYNAARAKVAEALGLSDESAEMAAEMVRVGSAGNEVYNAKIEKREPEPKSVKLLKSNQGILLGALRDKGHQMNTEREEALDALYAKYGGEPAKDRLDALEAIDKI